MSAPGTTGGRAGDRPGDPLAGDRASGDRASGERVDRALRALDGLPADVPPLSAALEAELDDLRPVRLRSPRRTLALAGALSMLYALGIILWLAVRPDLEGLPAGWMIGFVAAWLVGFGALGWLALVPPRGAIMPNWRYAGLGALIAAVGFIAAGLLLDRHVPGVSIVSSGLSDLIEHGWKCVMWGLITALVPVALGALFARGTVPVGSRWVGAAIGAAGGCLGGFVLHVHCHVADAIHLGLVHGGLVALAALVGAMVIPRVSA